MTGWRNRFRRHRTRAEWAGFVHNLSGVLGQAILTVALSWMLDTDEKSSDEHSSSSSSSSGSGRSVASWAVRGAAALLLGGANVHVFSSRRQQQHFRIAAVGLPLAIVGYVRQLGAVVSRLPTVEKWAADRKYWEEETTTAVHVETTSRPAFGSAHPLAVVAVGVEQACLVLVLVVMVLALDRLLSLQEVIASFVASRHGKNGGGGRRRSAIKRVYRITRQFDVSVTGTADEYQITDNPNQLTQHVADRVFGMFEEAGEVHSQLAVWLGNHACLGNFTPPTPEPTGRTGRVPSALALECVGTAILPLAGVDVLNVYVPSTVGGDDGPDTIEDASRGSIVASMDAVLRLLALYDCEEHGFVAIGRDVNFAGRFPVSRRGLQALAKDPNQYDTYNRHRQRCLILDRLGLAEDQWGCLLRSCDGPGVTLPFFGARYGQHPEAMRVLIQALAENECRAHVSVSDAHSLPDDVIRDLAVALGRNSSLTDLALTIRCENERTGFSDPGAARAAGDTMATTIFDGLAQRAAPLDVLELHVPVFSSHLWNRLWDEVVPAAGLYLKSLVLRTGSGLDPRTRPMEYNVEEVEEPMIRAVSASNSLCAFDYKDWMIPNNSCDYLERIELAVRPFLRFNRFRRFVLRIEHEPSVALQKRWFATTLRRSVACREPAWCYFLLKGNVAGFHECIDGRSSTATARVLK